MPYIGKTYRIQLSQTGFNNNTNIDAIPPYAMVEPSKNVILNEGGVRKRGGTLKVDTATMGAVSVTGLYDFTLVSGTQFILRATSDGKLWKTVADTIKTGWTADKFVSISQTGDTAVFCNGADCPTTWDGVAASTTDLTPVPTDWTGTNFPRQIIFHGSGNSYRGWAFGCPSTPKTIYITPDGSPTDFTEATLLTLNIETGDGTGIVGAIEFGDRLIFFSKTKAFIIDDTDTDTDNWGYNESQWYGGAANNRLIVKTPNDVVCMMENGEIYSITAAQSYGDYTSASLTRPSFMHEWVKTYVNLSYIADFHAIYDPVLRAIIIFVVRTGFTEIDTALVYFIDRSADNAWTILDNQAYTSGYSCLSAALVRVSAGSYKIYTGCHDGRVRKLNEVNRNDDSNNYDSRYKTPPLSFDDPRSSKRYDVVRLITASPGAQEAMLKWWIDGEYIGQKKFSFASIGSKLGSFVLDVDALGGTNILESSVQIGEIGKRIQCEISNPTANRDFFLSQILIDFQPLGPLA